MNLQTQKAPHAPSFESVWATLDRMAAADERRQAEWDRRQAEWERRQAEWEQQQVKAEKEWEEIRRQQKETDRRMGYLDNRFGELVEHLVAPNIVEKFNALGYHFGANCQNRKIINPDTGDVIAEVDIYLENNDFTVAVEVKSTPSTRDVKDHLERLKDVAEFNHAHGDTREVRGAIAGAVFHAPVKAAAFKAGLYVITQTGDTVQIEQPEGFVPRGW